MSTTPTIPESPYLTAEEAAEYLRFSSLPWFRRAVRIYGIPCLRRGRRLFFTQTDLDQFMAVVTDATSGQRKLRRKRAH
jgi:excisionase family DNA binding protein